MLGGFANKTFTVSQKKIYTFFGYTNNFSLNIEEQEVDGSKPSTYIKGKALEDPSFNIKLRISEGVNVQKEVDDWRNICNSCSPHMLFIGNKAVSNNKYLLTAVSLSDTEYLKSGVLAQCTLKLDFKEYVRKGVKKEEGTSSSTKKKTSTAKKKSSKKSASKNKSSGSYTMSKSQESKVAALEKSVYGG